MDNKKIRVLLIEDSVDDTALIKRKLANSAKTRFMITDVKTLKNGLEHLTGDQYDLIISDLGLPDSQGLDTVKQILTKAPHVPLVVLSGLDDDAIAIKAVKAGAQDYLVKGQIENSQLERSLHYSLERASLLQELKQRHQEISNVQTNLNKILDKITDAIFVTNKIKQILYANPAAAQLMGREQTELQKEKFSYKLNPGETQEIEITQPDASVKTADMTVVDVEWGDRPAYLISTHDITHRKQMEQAIAVSEEKFSKIFLHLPESISITRVKDGTFLDANDSFCQNMGLKRQDLIDHTVDELGLRNKLTDRKMMIKQIKEQGVIFSQEYSGTTPNGEPAVTLISADIIDINNEPCIVVIAKNITERKRMEHALKESEEKFSKTFQAIPESISISRVKDGVLIDVNEVFCRVTGHSREEIIGHTAEEIGLLDPPNQRVEIIKAIKENGPIQNMEVVSASVKEPMNTLFISADIVDINGEPCLISVTTNITHRKQMEQAMAESEEKFAKVFLHNPEVILITDINDSTIIDANDAFIRQTGHDRDDVIGREVTDFVKWAAPNARQDMVKTIKEKKSISNLECIFSIGKGEFHTWLFSGEIINIGGRLRILSVIIDITERKKMEDKLRFSDTALKSIHEGIIVMDTAYTITQWNDMSEQMFGIKAPDAIGKSVTDVIHIVEDYTGHNDTRLETLLKKGFNREEQRYKTPRGEMWVDVQTQKIEHDGKEYGWLTLFSDISERKKMEDQLRFSDIALKSIREGVIAVDNDQKITHWNEMCEKIIGVKAADAIGKSAFDVIDLIEDYEGQNKARFGPLEENGYIREEQRYQTSRGEIWVDVQSQEMKKNGERFGWLNLISDITDRKKMEDLLRFSDFALKSIHEGVYAMDNDLKVTHWNETCEQMFGVKASDATGKTPQDSMLLIETYKGQIEQRIDTIMKHGFARDEQLYRTPHGDIWVDAQVQAIEFNGKRYGWLSLLSDITARKNAEDALKQSEEKFRELISTSMDAIITTDENMKITLWNTGAEQIFGYTEEEMLGQPFVNLVPEIARKQILVDFHDFVDPGVSAIGGQVREFIAMRKDGTRVTVEISMSTRVADGAVIATGILRDITRRKEAEEKIRESEERYRDLFENATDLIQSCNAEGKFVYVNRAWRETLGYSEQEIVGLNLWDIIHPDHLAQCKQTLQEVLTGETVTSIETAFVTKSGKVIQVEGNVSPVKKGKMVTATRAIFRDITIRKQAEEAVKQSEEKYRELINTSNDAIVSVDSHSRFVLWNNGAEKMLGYTEKEVLGLSLLTFFPETSQKNVARELVQLRNTGSSKTLNKPFETTLLKKDCSIVPIEMAISTRRSDEGIISTAIIRDITVRKEAEAKLKQIDQMKSDFLSNISHELRTPLQSISGFTKLIMNGDVPDQQTQQEFLQIIDRETIHLGNLVNGLLDMSRLEIGRFQINRKPTAIRETIIDALKIFMSLSHEKQITLQEDLPADLPVMNVDNERMRQVVVNLVGNAIKFSDPGGSVTVNAEIKDNMFLFHVADHGTGIHEENIKHLFERFYREEGEKVRGGTGLGLYISKQIIDAHGGRIWAESIFGKGSTFSFSLPLDGKGGDTHG